MDPWHCNLGIVLSTAMIIRNLLWTDCDKLVCVLFVQIVDDAISAGIDGYDADMKAAVRNGVTGLRLTQESAMAIAAKAVSTLFHNSLSLDSECVSM